VRFRLRFASCSGKEKTLRYEVCHIFQERNTERSLIVLNCERRKTNDLKKEHADEIFEKDRTHRKMARGQRIDTRQEGRRGGLWRERGQGNGEKENFLFFVVFRCFFRIVSLLPSFFSPPFLFFFSSSCLSLGSLCHIGGGWGSVD